METSEYSLLGWAWTKYAFIFQCILNLLEIIEYTRNNSYLSARTLTKLASKIISTTRFFISNAFFINNAFFQLRFSVAKRFHELSFLNTYHSLMHHYTETHFMFSIFVPMSRPKSIYVLTIWSIFHFQPHFHCHWSNNI